MWRRFSEEERQTIWDMREAGFPVKRIARHLGRQNVSARKFIADAGTARPLASGPSCGSRLKNARRSPVGWRRVTPSEPSLQRSAVRLRPCVGRSTPTVAERRIGPSWPTGRPAGGRCGPLGSSWPVVAGCRGWSSARSRPSGHPSRFRRGWLWSIPIARRCRCPTRPSTSRSSSSAVERCAKSSHTCLRTGRALSRPKTYVKGNRIGAGKIKDMVMISERSAVAMRWTPKSAEAMLKMRACTYAAISTASGPITSNKISYGSTKEVAARRRKVATPE